MLKKILALVAMLFLGACSTMKAGDVTMRGGPAEAEPPKTIALASGVPHDLRTYHYTVTIYPGVGKNFNPNPKLTLDEYNMLSQLDWYCARKTNEIDGKLAEMGKQGLTYGLFEGVLGALGYQWGFGSMIHPMAYFKAIGLTAAGGGLASGKITMDMALNVVHGYCMTGMVYKADEIENQLTRIFIAPFYAGTAKLSEVSDASAPTFPATGNRKFLLPPPH